MGNTDSCPEYGTAVPVEFHSVPQMTGGPRAAADPAIP
jgi:hypothetical protein